MTFREEIIDKIFEYECYILMKEDLPVYEYVLQDIEDGLKIVLMDRNWHEPYYSEINDVYYLHFPWKRNWIQQPLEGAALYIGRGRIVCSKRVTEIEDNIYNLRHPYYRTKFSNWVKPTR